MSPGFNTIATRALVVGSLWLALGLRLAAAQATSPWNGMGVSNRPQSMVAPVAIVRVGLTVGDMDRSIDFYTRVLTFRVVADTELVGPALEARTGVFGARVRRVNLQLGTETLELSEYLASSGRPAPIDSRSNDRWFQHVAIIVSNMDSAYRRLRSFHVRQSSTGPQLLPATIPNAAGISAFYFRDPDGHPLEILHFPPDKGAARWHAGAPGLFLGIDHSAIVVNNTAASLHFYRDLLGLTVAGQSHNFGTEQAHLNNVEGTDLQITGLRAPAGPGVEFLQYLSPRDGRPYPSDERPNDLVHWQTELVVTDAVAAMARLRAAGVPIVSRPEPGTSGPVTDFLIRDPDGHVVELLGQGGLP